LMVQFFLGIEGSAMGQVLHCSATRPELDFAQN
jgi:hypothetical protein